MTIDPVKIPQNVYVEDHIVGSISLRQIIICLLSGGLSYGIFASVQAAGLLSGVMATLSWTPLVIGAAFAFIKINGITLTRFCLLIIEKTDKPAIRVWAPRRGITISLGAASAKSEKEVHNEKVVAEAKHRADEKRSRIHELSALLDKGPDETDEEIQQPDLPAISSPEPERSSLPVDKNRVRAEPLDGGTSTLDGVHPPVVEAVVIRDITPPALR